MPTPSDRAPSQFQPFAGEEEHLRAHRALDAALIGVDSGSSALSTVSVTSLTATTENVGTSLTNTASNLVLIANRVGLGGAVPATSSTAAPIKGIFRSAAGVQVRIPATSASTCSIMSVIFSAAGQMGNPIEVGDPVQIIPLGALPANCFLLNAYVVDTNSITAIFGAATGAISSTTLSFHVLTFDQT